MTAGAGNLADWSDVSLAISPPSVRLVAQAVQSLPHNTATAIAFGTGSEILDTNNWHDESGVGIPNTRIQPNIAGWYDVWGTVAFSNRTDYITMQAWIRTNGTTAQAPAGKPPLPAAQIASTTMVAVPLVTVLLNGSTDYVELMGQHSNGAAAAQSTALSFQFASVLELKFRMRA